MAKPDDTAQAIGGGARAKAVMSSRQMTDRSRTVMKNAPPVKPLVRLNNLARDRLAPIVWLDKSVSILTLSWKLACIKLASKITAYNSCRSMGFVFG